MNRYEYVSQHINAFQHEYKMLITGKMTAEQLPIESVQGILYHMLQQLMDCYHSLSMFDNHIEFIEIKLKVAETIESEIERLTERIKSLENKKQQ